MRFLSRMRSRIVSLLLPLVACGDPSARGATQVKMLDNAYNAPVVRIPEGAGVIFTNAGRNPHNLVPVDPDRWPTIDTSAVTPGGKRTVQLAAAGVYEYYCSYHGTRDGLGMWGAVVVGDTTYTGHRANPPAAVPSGTGTVRRVPAPYGTIQGAVDAAAPGDLILIAPGIYREEVTVTTPSLVIRGLDRNTTIVDGEFIRPNGFNVLADAVAIENITARHATLNGFFWTGVTGYRGRYLTAYNNGDYGIYAFDSRDGLFEDSYASGAPDAGFYIGQCAPCDAIIRRVISEHNAVGYSGTNAGGNLFIEQSIWRHNRGGLVPNTLDTELYPPQRRTVIRGNLIHSNHSRTAPGRGLSPLAWGNGIVLGGGRDNVVEDNVIVDHVGHGVMIAPLADANFWPARGNVVRNNRVANNGRADVAIGGPASLGNRVDRQRSASRTAPRSLGVAATSARPGGEENDLTPTLALALRIWRLRGVEYPSWKTQPVPPPQPTMPDAASAPAVPAMQVFARAQADTTDDRPVVGAEALFQQALDTPVRGMAPAIAHAQAFVPLTPVRLLLLVLLLGVQRALLWHRRRRGHDVIVAQRAFRLVLAVGVAWIGLALTVATLYSGI
jgi:plastocyanin